MGLDRFATARPTKSGNSFGPFCQTDLRFLIDSVPALLRKRLRLKHKLKHRHKAGKQSKKSESESESNLVRPLWISWYVQDNDKAASLIRSHSHTRRRTESLGRRASPPSEFKHSSTARWPANEQNPPRPANSSLLRFFTPSKGQQRSSQLATHNQSSSLA